MLIISGVGYLYFRDSIAWVVGGIAVVVAALMFMEGRYPITSRRRVKRPSSISERSAASDTPAAFATAESATSTPVGAEKIANDPFAQIANGRIVKRVLPDLQDLLAQPGMIEVFKRHSARLSRKSSGGLDIWYHEAGIYMAVPEAGKERLFSTISAARDYHSRHPSTP